MQRTALRRPAGRDSQRANGRAVLQDAHAAARKGCASRAAAALVITTCGRPLRRLLTAPHVPR